MRKKTDRLYTRRGALVLIGIGGGILAVETGAFTRLSADRGVNVSVANDEDAAFGVLIGLSSILVSNNVSEPITVEVTETGDASVIGDNEIELDPRDPDDLNGNDDDDPGTHTFLFEDGSTDSAEITLAARLNGTTITLTREVEIKAIEENRVELLIEQENDSNVHTWTIPSAADKEDVEGDLPVEDVDNINVNYSDVNGSDLFNDTRRQDVTVTLVTDTGTDDEGFQNIRIDRSELKVPDGEDFDIPIRNQDTFDFGSNSTSDDQRLIIGIGRVADIADADDPENAEITLKGEDPNTDSDKTVTFGVESENVTISE